MQERKKQAKRNSKLPAILSISAVLLVIAGVAFYVIKYAPTSEHVNLSEYYGVSGEECVVVIDGEQIETEADDPAAGLVVEGSIYIRTDVLKDRIDDGYVFDDSEKILRYATDSEVITAQVDSTEYTMGKKGIKLDAPIVLERNYSYVLYDFFKLFSGSEFSFTQEPNIIAGYSEGSTRKVAALNKDTAVRRLGGNKSKILKDAKKDEEVSIIESYGKWTRVETEEGILGCVKNSALGDTKKVSVDSGIADRNYNHLLVDEKINMLWHQVSNTVANSSLSGVLTKAQGINVISPTWFRISDNYGDLFDLASPFYVTTCHNKGIQVWALVSNFEVEGVDTALVLNTTSSRDNLVNNLIAKAVTYDLDGLNIDFELVPVEARDGFIQFIKELSIRCEKNDIILSVDNYVPIPSNAYYNRSVQADYADYIITMAYDEHYSGSEEAGSNSSAPYVRQAVEDTLKEVPSEQFILGLPFYAREFTTTEEGITNKPMGMSSIPDYIKDHDLETTWLEKEEQNYVEYQDETGGLHQLWIEDSKSLARKMMSIKDENLAGGAFWKAGYEDATIWDVIAGYIN